MPTDASGGQDICPIDLPRLMQSLAANILNASDPRRLGEVPSAWSNSRVPNGGSCFVVYVSQYSSAEVEGMDRTFHLELRTDR